MIHDIGYNGQDEGFNADTCKVTTTIHSQSGDIAMGVDRDGAGDQGLMFGYACKQTDELMPLPIALSHRILEKLNEARYKKEVDWLRPDSKSQVTVEFDGRKAIDITAIVVSTQHSDKVEQSEIAEFIRKKIIPRAVPEHLLTRDTKYHINPTGRFVIGGPHGDCGLTGRKIIVDTYGGWGRAIAAVPSAAKIPQRSIARPPTWLGTLPRTLSRQDWRMNARCRLPTPSAWPIRWVFASTRTAPARCPRSASRPPSARSSR